MNGLNKTEKQIKIDDLNMSIAYCEKNIAVCCNKGLATGNLNHFFDAGVWIDLLHQKSMELETLQKRETQVFGRNPNGFKFH